MKSRFLLSIIIMGMAVHAYSQNVADAIRYSYLTYSNSGRNTGVSNSLGALGTDFGSISQNPGGLGWYRSSEFNFSLGTSGYNTTAKMSGIDNHSSTTSARKFGIPGVGLVFNSKPRNENWRNVNFAFGMNQTASYKQEYNVEGITKGSVMNYFVEQAQGKSAEELDQFSSGLAYGAYALYDPDESNNNDKEWTSDFHGATTPLVSKSQEVLNAGYMNEVIMALGANYKDKLTFGASMGIPILRFETQSFYSEDNSGPDKVPLFNSLEWNEDVQAKGAGINLKIGANYRPIQAVRIGAAFHSPTALAITEEYNNSFRYNFTLTDGTNYNTLKTSPTGEYDYTIVTPWRFVGDAGVLIGKKGFVSAEIEYVDYPSARFSFSNTGDDPEAKSYQRELNNSISKELKPGVNYKIGAEVALGEFRLRGGYGIYDTPYANDSKTNSSYSAGLGGRFDKFFFDLGFIHFTQSQSLKPYVVSNSDLQPIINSELNTNRFILTVGFKF